MRVLRLAAVSNTTSPPRPPSPPSGPPNSMNFSRRKLDEPAPPSPLRRKILHWSRNCTGRDLTSVSWSRKRGNAAIPPSVSSKALPRPGGTAYSAASAGRGRTETNTRPRRPRWKLTCPPVVAKIVWSRPIETLRPGWNSVPRWRTRMLPDTTISPPNLLTPRRRPAESRPLREEPPAFLWAMENLLLLAGADAGDLQDGERLPMADLAAIVVAPSLLEDQDLVALLVPNHGGGHLGAGHHGRAHRGRGAVGYQQHLAERHRGARLCGHGLNDDHVVLGDLILLSAGADHGIHDGCFAVSSQVPGQKLERTGRPPSVAAGTIAATPLKSTLLAGF